uniref:Uncharacterized protein n=1 Tax=Nelumbo nucifera TaxID=4432 RepID=A0A822Y3T9_NELNU|nr:TPA_asm: hypothetical protein HUJ06_028131 [Nelumbo nucifera]
MYAAPVGVALGMLFSVLCCITAEKVEARRLSVIRKHVLLEMPDNTIPMSVFWLLPQFLLLGALDGLARNDIKDFFGEQAPQVY